MIKDDEEAVKWYRLSSDGGYAKATYLLAGMYDAGKGVARDRVEASRLYLKAALKGDVASQKVMAKRYALGQELGGITLDLKEAYAWHNIVAATGDEEAAKSRAALETSEKPEWIAAAQKRTRELLKELEAIKGKQ